MVQSVELLLDDAADRRIRSEWAQLIDAELPSQGRHTGPSNRPHITLAVAGALSTDDEMAVENAANDGSPDSILLGGALVFGARTFVLARSVVPTVELLRFQQRIVGVMTSSTDSRGHQAPGRWTPHVTLARRMSAAQIATALNILAPIDAIDAQLVAVRRWDGDRKIDWLIT